MTAETLEIEVAYAGSRRERPPLVRLLFDVRLANRAAGPRWFLLPDRLDGDEPWPGAGVSGVDVLELRGERPPLLVRFAAARGAFQGVLLPGGGEAALRRLPIRLWGSAPERAAVEVVLARRLTIDGRDVATWLGGAVETAAGASGDAAGARRVLRRHSDDFSEFPLAVEADERRSVAVELRGEQVGPG